MSQTTLAVLPTGSDKVRSDKNLYVKRGSTLGRDDKEIVSKVIEEIEACIIQLDPQNWPILMQNTKRLETKHEDDTNKIYGFVLFERYEVKITIPEGRNFFFVDFRMNSGDHSLAKQLAEKCQLQLAKYTVCEWAQEKPTEETNLYLQPLPEFYRNSDGSKDDSRLREVIIGYMDKINYAVEIKSTKITVRSQDKPPIGFCRFTNSDQAAAVERCMHGKNWSELGFVFGLDEHDRQITVKKANKRPAENQNSYQVTNNQLGSGGAFSGMQTQNVYLSGLPFVQTNQIQQPIQLQQFIQSPATLMSQVQLVNQVQQGTSYTVPIQQTIQVQTAQNELTQTLPIEYQSSQPSVMEAPAFSSFPRIASQRSHESQSPSLCTQPADNALYGNGIKHEVLTPLSSNSFSQLSYSGLRQNTF
jgi:hypothetical protein